MILISENNRKKLVETLRSSGFLWTVSMVLSQLGFRVLRFWPDRMVEPDTLKDQLAAVLRTWGMAEKQVAVTVEQMIYADLHGIDSHGSSMLLHYHRLLKSQSITMTPNIRLVHDNDTTALIDGGGGLGHVVADTAMRLAIEKCRGSGIAAIAVRNSGHYGAAGAYAAMAAQSGLIGFATTSVPNPALVPTQGRTAMLGTNPLAFAASARGNRPFLLDMATSIVPLGKLVTARRKGNRIPAGWARDRRDRVIRNPDKAISQRRVAPLGGTPEMGSHKGYGLAAMVEILSSTLSGNNAANGGVGHFFLVLDPAQFGATDDFERGLGRLMDGLRSSEPMRAGQAVQVAGDPEYETAAKRRQTGFPLTRSVVEDIRKVCRESGAPFLLDETP